MSRSRFQRAKEDEDLAGARADPHLSPHHQNPHSHLNPHNHPNPYDLHQPLPSSFPTFQPHGFSAANNGHRTIDNGHSPKFDRGLGHIPPAPDRRGPSPPAAPPAFDPHHTRYGPPPSAIPFLPANPFQPQDQHGSLDSRHAPSRDPHPHHQNPSFQVETEPGPPRAHHGHHRHHFHPAHRLREEGLHQPHSRFAEAPPPSRFVPRDPHVDARSDARSEASFFPTNFSLASEFDSGFVSWLSSPPLSHVDSLRSSNTSCVSPADYAKSKLDSLLRSLEVIDSNLETGDVSEENLDGPEVDVGRPEVGLASRTSDASGPEVDSTGLCEEAVTGDLLPPAASDFAKDFVGGDLLRPAADDIPNDDMPTISPATSQERLLTRLEKVDDRLDELDDKRVECYGGEKARKPVRRAPEQTVVYDMKRSAAILMTLDDYYKSNGRPKAPEYTVIYDEKTQSVKLVFWCHYIRDGHQAKDLDARKPKPIPDYTMDYDAENKTAKLVLLEKYLRNNKVPKQDYAAVYDPATQGIKLIFWKQYLENYYKEDLKARHKPIPHYTVVYNKKKQEAELVTWDKYLQTHRAPPCPVYAALYDEKTKGIKLVFWNQYLRHHLPKDLEARKPKALPKLTMVYDKENQSAKLQLWEEHKKLCPKKWTQAYAAVYDKKTQSVKLVFWKNYVESFLPKDVEARKPRRLPELTAVYDAEKKAVKLVRWEEYLKTNKAPPTGELTTVYDAESQSCKLVTWRDYLQHYQGKEAVALVKKTKAAPTAAAPSAATPAATAAPAAPAATAAKPAAKKETEYTAVYDSKTQSVQLQPLQDYLKANKPKTQAYAAVYDPLSKSVQLIFWKQYLESYLKKDEEARKARRPKILEQTVVYDAENQSAKLQPWDEYVKANKPVWKQDYTAVYDEDTKSVKLIFWKQYLDQHQEADLKTREARKKVKKGACQSGTAARQQICKPAEMTTVYDPENAYVRLVPWNDYVKSHKVPAPQFAADYDQINQAVKLVFLKKYESPGYRTLELQDYCI